jgi:uncharacterized protein YndB with AHSA1/START domain
MLAHEESIHIDAPPEEVFRYVTDIKRHPEWASNPMQMRVDDEPVQVGTNFHSEVAVFGKETCDGRVIELEAPHRFAYMCDTSTSGLWRWTMTLTPEGNGTKLTHHGEAEKAAGWFRVVTRLTWPFVGKKMRTKGLAKLKQRIEAGAAREAVAG